MKNKVLAALATVLAVAGSAMAEGAATSPTSALVETYITDGKTQIMSVLTAGAAIVGAFFVWGLIKKALRSSK